MSKTADTTAAPLDARIGELPRFETPEKFTLSSSWRRAQETTDSGGRINEAERMVSLSDSDGYHRVVWVLSGASLRVEWTVKPTITTTGAPIWRASGGAGFAAVSRSHILRQDGPTGRHQAGSDSMSTDSTRPI